jgi:hypothetical protein
MAGCWLLLKNPTNRQVLGNAFNANPASTKLAQGMMQKLQATVDVADVNEAVSAAGSSPLGWLRCCPALPLAVCYVWDARNAPISLCGAIMVRFKSVAWSHCPALGHRPRL